MAAKKTTKKGVPKGAPVRFSFSLETRAEIARRFKLSSADPDAADAFVHIIESLLHEVKQPPRDAEQSREKLQQVARSFAKSADLLFSMTRAEILAIVLAAPEVIARSELATAGNIGIDGHGWQYPRARASAKRRMAAFGRTGLQPAMLSPENHAVNASTLESLRRFADDLSLIAAAAQVAEPNRPSRLPKPQSIMARAVLDTLAAFDLEPGGREGFAAFLLGELLATAGMTGSAGSLIEQVKRTA